MAAGLAIATVARLPFAWDGAWFFVYVMDSGAPILLNRRAIHAILQAPTLVSRLFVDDIAVPALLFSAAYALVPLVGVLAAWRVVRHDRPALILWPMLGVALAALPGQAFFASDSGMVAHLAWPLVLAAATGRIDRHRRLLVGLTLAIAVGHPYAGPTLALVGLVAWIARAQGIGRDGRRAGLAFVLAGAVIAFMALVLRTPYELEASSLDRLASQFRGGLAGPAAIAPIVAWLIGAGAFLAVPTRVRTATLIALLGLAALMLVPWSLDDEGWSQALRYRAWFVFLTLPLYAMAVVDAQRGSRWTDRRVGSVGVPVIMALVLAGQSVTWLGLQARLADSIADAPPGCVTAAQVAWLGATPLDHWSVTSLGLILEGRDPKHLVVAEGACDGAVSEGSVTIKSTLYEQDNRPVDGWWRFGSLVAAWPGGS